VQYSHGDTNPADAAAQCFHRTKCDMPVVNDSIVGSVREFVAVLICWYL